ncbi:MAG: hypothetical protein ABFS19_11525 [Thermodesulfobacteriota bacterium]
MDLKIHLEKGWQTTLKLIIPSVLLTLGQVVLTAVSFGILAPVTFAGYTQSLLLALREGREPKLGDLFSEMNLFFPLLLFGFLAMMVTVLGFLFFVLPGFVVAGLLVFACLYMVPLMTDQEEGLLEAIKKSWQMATREPITDQVVVTLIYMVIVSLGSSVAVAVLFTQPLATFFILSVYEERITGPQREKISAPPPPPPEPGEGGGQQ